MSKSSKRVRPKRRITVDTAVWERAKESLNEVQLQWDTIMPGATRGRNRKQKDITFSMSELIEVLLDEFARIARREQPPPKVTLGGFLFPSNWSGSGLDAPSDDPSA